MCPPTFNKERLDKVYAMMIFKYGQTGSTRQWSLWEENKWSKLSHCPSPGCSTGRGHPWAKERAARVREVEEHRHLQEESAGSCRGFLWVSCWVTINLTSPNPGSGRASGEGTGYLLQCSWTSLVAQMVKNQFAMQETWVRPLGWEGPWRMAWQPTPVFLSGESPWTGEPGGLQSMGSQRVRHKWATEQDTNSSGSMRAGNTPRFQQADWKGLQVNRALEDTNTVPQRKGTQWCSQVSPRSKAVLHLPSNA